MVITGGWCVAKKKGTHIQRTPPPMEKKTKEKKTEEKKTEEKKTKEKKKEVPSTGIELANFDFIV